MIQRAFKITLNLADDESSSDTILDIIAVLQTEFDDDNIISVEPLEIPEPNLT